MVFSKRICRIVGATLLMATFSCGKDARSYHYDQDKLVDVIIDVHIARSALQNAPLATRDSMYVELFNQICSIHHVSKDSISLDLERLTEDPEYLERIYEMVIDSLEINRIEDQAEY